MICTHCGADMPDDSSRCGECGKLVAEPTVQLEHPFDADEDVAADPERLADGESETAYPDTPAMSWRDGMPSRVQPPTPPEQPRLGRIVVLGVGAIALAFAVLITIAAILAVVRMI